MPLEEMLNAKQFAEQTGRPVRTVQEWAIRGEVPEAQKVGQYWIASRSAWEAAAAIERRPGRKPGTKPQEP